MNSNQNLLKEKLFFTTQDVAAAHGISPASASVLCSRYALRGIFIRIKKNFYILERNWERYGQREFFQICNFLQVPSYVSGITALAFHGMTTQVQRNWYENITWRRTTKMENRGVSFRFHKVQRPYYFGFVKQNGFFIAEPEKALLDAAYLDSLGICPMDWSSLDPGALDKQKLAMIMEPFPNKVKNRIAKSCKI